MHHFTCWTLFISRINRAWLRQGLNDWHRQQNSDLAQLAECATDDQEVVGSIPARDNFFILLFSFNASRTWQKISNYVKTRIWKNVTVIWPIKIGYLTMLAQNLWTQAWYSMLFLYNLTNYIVQYDKLEFQKDRSRFKTVISQIRSYCVLREIKFNKGFVHTGRKKCERERECENDVCLKLLNSKLIDYTKLEYQTLFDSRDLLTGRSSFSIIVIEFDEFNELKIWWCHCKKVTHI